jgi:hypothetical protein
VNMKQAIARGHLAALAAARAIAGCANFSGI